jgi:hypothetical protein
MNLRKEIERPRIIRKHLLRIMKLKIFLLSLKLVVSRLRFWEER